MFLSLVARVYWRFSRWTLRSEPGPDRPSIIIGAPHTSNWDFVLMCGIAWHMRLRFRWLGKHTLFTGWRGPIMRRLGGIPVHRDHPEGLVDEIVAMEERGKPFSLVITPEGTRHRAEYWKSGFYRIAESTGLPVTLGYVDGATMTTGLGPTIEMTGDVHADMDRIRAFYADKHGLHPELRTEPRLRHEGPTPEGGRAA